MDTKTTPAAVPADAPKKALSEAEITLIESQNEVAHLRAKLEQAAAAVRANVNPESVLEILSV